MKQKYFAIFLFSSLLILSCSSSKETSQQNNEADASESVITSSHLKIIVPSNWQEINDNYDRLFEIWLVREDNNAVISFIPIHLTDKIDINNETDKLSLMEKIILAKKERNNSDFKLIESKSFPAKYFNKSNKYYLGDQLQNSIIFGNNEVYYECLLYFNNKYEPEESEIDNLIELQQKIIFESIIK
jgi:hypothetical protein